MVKIFKCLFLTAVLLILSGCTTLYNPATGRNEMIFLNSASEVSIGQGVIPDFLKQHPLSTNSELRRRVEAVGGRLAAVSDRQDIAYHYDLLADKELNALALPGGYVYVYEGLAKILNDDELAYVIGHETGHVAARHIAKQMQANMTYQVLLGIAFAAVGDKAGGSSDTLAQGMNTIYNMVALGYSRQDEYQADRLGARYAFRAGYNPWASLSALEKIKKEEGPNWKVLGYFRSHPYVEDRIKALQTAIPQEEGTAR
jgi:predicted Zn-dependent protease